MSKSQLTISADFLILLKEIIEHTPGCHWSNCLGKEEAEDRPGR